MSTEIKWIHKNFELEDRDRVLALRERVFSEPEYGIERWSWQYQSNPMGPSYIDLAVDKEEDKTLAGHYAVISYKFSMDGKEVQGAQSLDTFTSPDYTRQGIFVKLAEQTYSKSFEDGVKFIFGFPNKLSYPGFVKKLNFKDPFGFKIHKLPLRLGYATKKFPILNVFKNIPLNLTSMPEGVELKKLSSAPKDLDLSETTLLNDIPYKVKRDANYLEWRYFNCPDRNYDIFEVREQDHLLGVVVGRVEGDYAHLVDLIPTNKESLCLLVEAFVAHYRKEGAHCVTCFLNEKNILESTLAKFGFRSTDKSEDFRFIIRTQDQDSYDERMGQSKNWYLLGGDTDFY
ncbi:GNAT family N-acetyltransferase [Bacteriovorax sp. DB6_IX]|uniref:GNAT family N-acetyltransferase n=1 Tax=Bacteriovorax sp. DB6_IX TaxID=1353530 RepID=UPI00038A274B|nr:GNAT family N-acetyltransferase [Bacteriovorax sp. DB6_IX]EQC51712.1 acetyltransferase (GNAT) domain protein [Bacteriovorax sp. DB6_IX]